MTDKDINIHAKVLDAEEGKKKLDAMAQSAKNMGDKTKEAGKKGAEGTKEFSDNADNAKDSFDAFEKKMMAWAGAVGGVTAIMTAATKAINENKQAIEEHGDVTEAHQKKLLRLQHLGGLFKDRPELRKEVSQLAESGRRDFAEVADAWYNLRSKGGALSDEQKDSIMNESLEMGRTDPDMPLDTLVDMFSLYAKKTGETDANKIQNVLAQTITEAGGSGSDVANYMPQFLPIGMAGGLSGAESAGLWSYATTQTSDAAIATTGLRATFMGLQGKGSPEGQKLLEGMGVDPGANFFDKLDTLSTQKSAGKFGLAEAEQMVGREGASILLDMLNNPQAMHDTIASVVAADRGDIDIMGGQIEELLGSDEFARTEDETRRLEVKNENLKGSLKALRWKEKTIREEVEMREAGASEARIKIKKFGYGLAKAVGVSPEYIEAQEDARESSLKRSFGKQMPSDSGSAGTTVINNNNDYSMKYYPKTGDPEREGWSQD